MQDRSAALDGDFPEHDWFPAAVTQHGTPAGRAYVADPAGVLTEHGHQVPPALIVGDDYPGPELTAQEAKVPSARSLLPKRPLPDRR